MSTIATATFNSEDEDVDCDYEYSGSSEDEGEQEHDKHKTSLKIPISSKINAIYKQLLETSASSSVHVHTKPDEFMLQFQRKSPRDIPQHTPISIMSFVRTALGDNELNPNKFDICEYKSKCRAEHDSVSRAAADSTIDYQNLADGEDVVVTEFVRYAGTVYQTQKRVRKDSLASSTGKRHRDDGKNTFGGVLDVNALLSKVSKAKNVSSVEKSLSDWRSHKSEDMELEDNLRQNRKDGYLGRQEFLHRSDVKRDVILQESRSKRRMYDSSSIGNPPGLP
eukprot:Lankesteria_metandrocarpae@DN3759_c0_g1_i2.p1